MPILICHIVWMPFYSGEEDVHAAGFDYVRDNGYGHELLNFKDANSRCYGYVQCKGGTINITRLGANKDSDHVDNVLVIWTAKPVDGERIVVGWYKNAHVFRRFQEPDFDRRDKEGNLVHYHMMAAASDAFLVPVEKRHFEVPHGKSFKGMPGQSSVFYPEDYDYDITINWLREVDQYINSWTGKPTALLDTKKPKWPSTPDAAHNAAVEAAAIACVRQKLVTEKADRQKDNCGWDLEFFRNDICLCVEVKGLSGPELCVELTPNEYMAMRRAALGEFHEGEYCLAIVVNALTHPLLHLFFHAGAMDWMCEITGETICVSERIGARLS